MYSLNLCLIFIGLTVGYIAARSVELHFGSEEKCRSGILYIIESRREKIIPSIYFETDRKQEVWMQINRDKSPEYLTALQKKLGNLIIEVRRNTVECIESKAELAKKILPSSCYHENKYNSWTVGPESSLIYLGYAQCIDEGVANLTKGYWKIKAELED